MVRDFQLLSQDFSSWLEPKHEHTVGQVCYSEDYLPTGRTHAATVHIGQLEEISFVGISLIERLCDRSGRGAGEVVAAVFALEGFGFGRFGAVGALFV